MQKRNTAMPSYSIGMTVRVTPACAIQVCTSVHTQFSSCQNQGTHGELRQKNRSQLSPLCINAEIKASVFEAVDALAAPWSIVMSQQVHPCAAHFWVAPWQWESEVWVAWKRCLVYFSHNFLMWILSVCWRADGMWVSIFKVIPSYCGFVFSKFWAAANLQPFRRWHWLQSLLFRNPTLWSGQEKVSSIHVCHRKGFSVSTLCSIEMALL